MTLSADDIIGFQRAMDNPPSGQALPSQWQGDAFKNKYHLSFSDDPFALFELYRQSCVPGREELHWTQFCSNNSLFLTDALVTPYYPGRAVESDNAKGLLNAISVIAEVSYNFLILENEFELPDDKKEVLLKNMSMVPLSVIALSIPLTNLFTSRGIHSSRDDRRQLQESAGKSKKKKKLVNRALLPELTTPSSASKDTHTGSYVGAGEVTKKGLPKQKMGRKSGTKMVNGKAVLPEQSERPKKVPIRRAPERPFQSSGGAHENSSKDSALTKRVSDLERENEEQRKTITQLQVRNSENVNEALRNDYKLRGAIETRTAIAKFIGGDKISSDPAFREISPMKKLRVTLLE